MPQEEKINSGETSSFVLKSTNENVKQRNRIKRSKSMDIYKGAHPKKMKVWISSKGGGGVKPQIQTFLVSILVILKENPGDGLGRVIPIFGSKL